MNLLKDKRGQIDLEDIHPLAVVFGIAGALIGLFMIKSMQGFNPTGEEYNIGIIWKILIPVVTGVASFFMTNKMFE